MANWLTRKRVALPLGAGLAGAAVLAGIYLGLVSLAESPAHALELFWDDSLFVVPIILGFGTQVGLFAYLKAGLFAPGGMAPAATTTAGGGVSTAAMVACCVHHLTDAAVAVPLVGLAGVATFLVEWRALFMALGLLTNLLGIGVMLRQIMKARRHWAASVTANAASAPAACHVA